jgi:hypothetical protein
VACPASFRTGVLRMEIIDLQACIHQSIYVKL